MGAIKEYRCETHGPFEGTHAICPEYGCDSAHVEREFRTPPAIRSATTGRTDAGLRQTADSYRIDLKSAREGESSKVQKSGLIWGLDNAGAALGVKGVEGMLHKPMSYERKDESGNVQKFVDKYGGMQHAASLVGNMSLFESKVSKTIAKADLKRKPTP